MSPPSLAFNRTIVELKFQGEKLRSKYFATFNRTIVELKSKAFENKGLKGMLLIVLL